MKMIDKQFNKKIYDTVCCSSGLYETKSNFLVALIILSKFINSANFPTSGGRLLQFDLLSPLILTHKAEDEVSNPKKHIFLALLATELCLWTSKVEHLNKQIIEN